MCHTTTHMEKGSVKQEGPFLSSLTSILTCMEGRGIQPTTKYLGKPVETGFHNEVENVTDIYWVEAASYSAQGSTSAEESGPKSLNSAMVIQSNEAFIQSHGFF